MKATIKASAKKLSQGMQVQTDAGKFRLILDEPESLGGTDLGMSPVEALLCALGACQSIVAASFAKKQGIRFEEFSVELEGDMDTKVRKGFEEIRYQMHFKSEEPLEKLQEFAAFIESRCPVGDCLQNGVRLVNAGVVVD